MDKTTTTTTTTTVHGATPTKDEWIDRAAAKLAPYEIGRDYAETLYESFVEGFGEDWINDPEGAVDEDMTYWDADE
jgi:hypothetical protein